MARGCDQCFDWKAAKVHWRGHRTAVSPTEQQPAAVACEEQLAYGPHMLLVLLHICSPDSNSHIAHVSIGTVDALGWMHPSMQHSQNSYTEKHRVRTMSQAVWSVKVI